MSQTSNDISFISNLSVPDSNIDEKTRAEVLSNVQSVLSNLSENRLGVSAYELLMRDVWKDVLPPSSWKRMKTPEAEELKTSRVDEYRDSLISGTFREVMEEKTAKHVSIKAYKNPSTGMYDTDVYVGSVFAAGQKDPQGWINELANSVITNETLRRTQMAAMGFPTDSSPSFLAGHTVSEIVDRTIRPASQWSEAGKPSGHDIYLNSFQSHGREETESFYEKVMSHEITRNASYLTDPVTKLKLSFRPYASMNQKDRELPGTIIASSRPNGQVTNSSIIRSIGYNKDKLEQLAASYQKATGKELPSLSNPDKKLFEIAPGYYRFQPSEEMVNGLLSSYSTNATSPARKSWEDVDLTETLSIPTKTYKKGVYPYYDALDNMIGDVSYKTLGTEVSPFRYLGMTADTREIDPRTINFHLVEESDLNGPLTIESFWPKDREEVLNSKGHSNSSHGESSNGFEAAGLLYI